MTGEGLRRAILDLTTIIEQDVQLRNLVQHAIHKPTFDRIRTDMGSAPLPADINGIPFAMVPAGPGCLDCKRTPVELMTQGHGPHALPPVVA